ncbi:hypothetical protein SAG0165_00010 [Streptococcus agalactiae MRI Z1-217]|uniref:Uncharacterized protein n=1 Tax=Streptococcus agalactiae MRI Z1-216 TaxID=1154879 RepID=A0AAD2WYC6_STRAG|nr:hypothetical protein SAG0161_12135 [Streptococcus agalactiae MRI Z1-213]EPU43499.1 hypothetical protein SAG0164_12420 [Streptococcus agalactiae MRI Z1-216]EPX04244.1 hypothetical protein SAG0165_00010 [Streptococcus agalactiae MRI Z1-217]
MLAASNEFAHYHEDNEQKFYPTPITIMVLKRDRKVISNLFVFMFTPPYS